MNKKQNIIIGLIVLVLIIIGAVSYFLFFKNKIHQPVVNDELISTDNPQWMINNDNLLRAVGDNDLGKVQEAIKAGADVNMRLADDRTVLSVAAEKGYLDIFKELVKDGADVNKSSGGSHTILMTIADYDDRLEIVKELIKDGIDVNAKDSLGWTALMYAAMGCKGEVAKELINAGADVNIKDDKGKTALIIASGDGFGNECLEFTNILKKAGAKE